MHPPIDESVLQNNPQFAALYSTLTTAILNPDVTTNDEQSITARERDDVRKELDNHRLKAAKKHLLAQALSSAAPSSPGPTCVADERRGKPGPAGATSPALPEELLDLLLLLPPLLIAADNELSPDSITPLLLSRPFSSLDTLMPELASLVSNNLQSSAVQLARAANPTTNPSFLHRHIPSVPNHVEALASTATRQLASLAEARRTAAHSLASLLAKHTQTIIQLIHALEAKHGGVARSLELRGTQIAQDVQRGELDAQAALWAVRRDLYPPEVRVALQSYALHLKDGQQRLKDAARAAEAELAEYGVLVGQEDGGEKLRERRFREIARAHRDARRGIEEAKRDLHRLH